MEETISRRRGLIQMGFGSAFALGLSQTDFVAAQGEPKLAVNRTNIVWGNRPMYLRAYHPPYVVYYYAAIRDGAVKNAASLRKWKPLFDRIENEPGLVIRIVEAYDDACAGCTNLKYDDMGSAWGVSHTCTSMQKPEVLHAVTLTSRRILGDMGLYYGSEITMRDLVQLLAINVPVLYDQYTGGPANQELYNKGLGYLKKKYGLL
jgi:hypothetical protein